MLKKFSSEKQNEKKHGKINVSSFATRRIYHKFFSWEEKLHKYINSLQNVA